MQSLSSNRLLASLLCLTLLFKVVVPVGFMPDLKALQHGIYRIMICSGHDDQAMSVDQNQVDPKQQKQTDHNTGKHDQICPFAGLHISALPATGFALALLILWWRTRYVPKTGNVRSVDLTSAWPRGPPVSLA